VTDHHQGSAAAADRPSYGETSSLDAARLQALRDISIAAMAAMAHAVAHASTMVAAGQISPGMASQITLLLSDALDTTLLGATQALADESQVFAKPAILAESEKAGLVGVQALAHARSELQARIADGEEFERVESVLQALAEKHGFALN